MACERHREALADVAAGAPAPADLEAHLGSCESCRAELAVLRRALAVADAEMAGLLFVEPSPALAARIRQVVTEPETAPPWRFGWLWPGVAAAATLLVALAVVMGRGTPPAARPQVAAGTARPEATGSTRRLEPGGEPVTPRSPGQAGRRGIRRVVIPAEPEVLVPPGEGEALLHLVALVHRERLTPPVLGAAGRPSADLAELAPIDIKPLEIVPLDPAETSGT